MPNSISSANPLANYFEAQTAATADIVQAALSGMQRIQQVTLKAMRTGAEGQFALAQSMTAARGADAGRAVADASGPASAQTARFQRELLQAIGEMNSNIMRSSYSMMERMRDAMSAVTSNTGTMLPTLPSSDAVDNPMAVYDAAIRQWQTTVQRMMDSPSVALAMATAGEESGARPSQAVRTSSARSSRATGKRKGVSRKR